MVRGRGCTAWTAASVCVVAGLLAGCGSRSPLLPGTSGGTADGGSAGSSGNAGFGGSGGTGGAGGGGVSGAAGSTSECNGIALNGSYATIDLTGPGHDSRPQLVRSSAAGDQITTVFVHEGDGMVHMKHATFLPWNAWPGDVSPTFESFVSPAVSPIFAAGSGVDDSFGLLVVAGQPSPIFVPDVDAWAPGGSLTASVTGDRAAFVTAGSSGHLVGTQTNDGSLLASLVASGNSLSLFTMACAGERPLGDAEQLGDDWLAATATASPVGTACGPGSGPPSLIEILRVFCEPGVCLGSESMALIEAGGSVEQLVTARHGDGLWVVWKTAFGSRIEWALFRRSTLSLVRGQVGSGSESPLEIAADDLGDSLVVAWTKQGFGSSPYLVISVLNDAGQTTGTTAIGPPLSGPISVVGSPSGDSVVAAWSGGAPSRVQLARFDCMK